MRDLNPIIDQNGLLRSSGRRLFAPKELEIEKCPIILDAKKKFARLYFELAHRTRAHPVTEPVKAFVQQRYYVIRLRKTLLSIKYQCFRCRRFDTQNMQPIKAPLPAFRFPKEETNFPFANTGLDFFARFILKTNKAKSRNITNLFLHASLREQSIWKHVQIKMQTPSSLHIDDAPAEDANLFCWTAIMGKHLAAPPKS